MHLEKLEMLSKMLLVDFSFNYLKWVFAKFIDK